MDNLIPVINKLQEIFNTVGHNSIELPQIVTVGTQSSGKSSVIEGIIRKDFLPRGCGMVTRRPLILQLISSSNSDKQPHEVNLKPPFDVVEDTFAVFSHDPDRVYTDFQDVHDEIIRETEKLVPNKKDVSSVPIILKIFSPGVLNLTLVDLPGLTRIPIKNQPIDIDEKITGMTLEYIKNKNSIILSIVPANIDIATSEAMRLASMVDPHGERTIICLTKLDLMDKGTSAYDILSGKVIKVKYDVIGVVNRSQLDIDNKKSVIDALQEEDKFFKQNYPMLAQWNGTAYLTRTLSKILLNHIKNSLPELKQRVQTLLHKFQEVSVSLGGTIIDKKFVLIDILTRFSANYHNAILGDLTSMTTKELFGGSRLYYIFHETFSKNIYSMDPLENIADQDILTSIRNSKGMNTCFFLPQNAFELLVRNQIKKVENPSLNCIEHAKEEMVKFISQVMDAMPEFTRFPNLRAGVSDVVKEILSQSYGPACTMIQNIISAEESYINTNHPDFLDILETDPAYRSQIHNFNDSMPLMHKNTKNETISMNGSPSREKIQSRSESKLLEHSKTIKILIKAYMKIIYHKIADTIPKIIVCFFVRKSCQILPNKLVSDLFNDSTADYLLSESPETVKQRESISVMINALSRANSLISELKDAHI